MDIVCISTFNFINNVFFLFGLSLDMGEVAQLLGITELMLTVAGGVIALMWMFFVVPPWE